MSLTSIARMFFQSRMRELDTYPANGEQMQRDVLRFLSTFSTISTITTTT